MREKAYHRSPILWYKTSTVFFVSLFFNSLRPGIITTERHSKIRSTTGYEERIVQRIPASKLATPEQVAQALLPLINEDSYINGTELIVSGGLPLFRTEI